MGLDRSGELHELHCGVWSEHACGIAMKMRTLCQLMVLFNIEKK